MVCPMPIDCCRRRANTPTRRLQQALDLVYPQNLLDRKTRTRYDGWWIDSSANMWTRRMCSRGVRDPRSLSDSRRYRYRWCGPHKWYRIIACRWCPWRDRSTCTRKWIRGGRHVNTHVENRFLTKNVRCNNPCVARIKWHDNPITHLLTDTHHTWIVDI